VCSSDLECEAKAGKIATALVHYEDYLNVVGNLPEAQKQRHAQRVDIARSQKKALAPEVPTLTLTVPKTAPSDLHVSRDGTELSAASLGVALPVDPGEHVVVTVVGAGPKQEQRIKVGKREKKTLEVQWKLAESSAPSATASAVATAIGTGDPAAGEKTGTSGRRIGAYVTGSLGLAGLVLGGVTGGLALGSKGSVDANCPGKICNETGAKALDSGRTMGLVSTVGFAVGGAGIAAALILWLTEPKVGKPAAVGVSVDVGPSFGMLRLKGAL